MRQSAVAVVGGLVLLAIATSVIAVAFPSPMRKTNNAEWSLGEPLLRGKEKVEADHDISGHQDVMMQAADVLPKADGHTLIATTDGQPVKLKKKHRGKGEHFSRQAKSKYAATHPAEHKPSRKDVKNELRRRLTSEYIRSRNRMSLPAVTASRPSAWASRRHEEAIRAQFDRRRQQQAELRSRARSHDPMQERMQAQHIVEKEAAMELDETKATLPAQSLLERAEERLSRLHLG